jgi:hypothetical protein
LAGAELTESRLLDDQPYDGVLDRLRHTVLKHLLLAADFLQGQSHYMAQSSIELGAAAVWLGGTLCLGCDAGQFDAYRHLPDSGGRRLPE